MNPSLFEFVVLLILPYMVASDCGPGFSSKSAITKHPPKTYQIAFLICTFFLKRRKEKRIRSYDKNSNNNTRTHTSSSYLQQHTISHAHFKNQRKKQQLQQIKQQRRNKARKKKRNNNKQQQQKAEQNTQLHTTKQTTTTN